MRHLFIYNSVFTRVSFILFIAVTLLFGCKPTEPSINERFPLKEPSQLSPPVVFKPIYECAEAVHVTSFIPHAEIIVYANGTEVIGTAHPPFGYADIVLTRPLKLGESITATQKVNTITSNHSVQPVIVGPYPPGGFSKPVVGVNLYECGVIVPVGQLVPSVKVHVFQEGIEVGSGPVATDWLPVWTTPLSAGKQVTAVQTACEKISGKTIASPVSDPVTVKPMPDPIPTPICDPNSIYIGNDAVTLGGLLVGAKVTVTDNGVVVGSGFVTGDANWVPLSQKITSGSHISAVQELCGKTSPPSTPVPPAGKLTAPIVLEPICAGARFVVVRNTLINATVVVLRNGSIVGYAGAVNGDLIVSLGGSTVLNAGDKIQAFQYMGNNISPGSNTVTVVRQLETPAVEITGGEHFFLAEGDEQAIDGPVFPRGRGNGPNFLVQACCDKKVQIEVKAPDGSVISRPDAQELFPGYYSARWNWTSFSNWAIPSGIPVGKYTITVHSDCAQQDVTRNFYVIFNPADVGGPARFSFDETGIWFFARDNWVKGLVYYLHPDDRRVFNIALNAASGQTDPKVAAGLVARAEEALFGYDLNYHSNDVVSMITSHSTAQCADDANVLTSLLRSVGIPAHPTSADADIETGPANWTFDTWTEFLVPGNPQPEWLIFHPHEYPNMSPETRTQFGNARSVAVKSFNDLIVMGGETWVWSEVSDAATDANFNRNSCTEPEQTITKKSWLVELCEQGYWNQSHWDCAGISARSASGLSVESVNVNSADAGFGRSLSGTIVFRNTTNRRIDALPVISIVSDLPESKKFPDSLLERYQSRISIAPGDTAAVPFRFKLPATIAAGYNLVLQTTDGKETMSVYPFALSGSIKTELRMADTMRIGSDITISAVVSNTSKQIVEGVSVKLELPFALRLTDRDIPASFILQPGESRNLNYKVRVVAPIDAGFIRLRTNSANGGADEVVRPLRVQGIIQADKETVPGRNK